MDVRLETGSAFQQEQGLLPAIAWRELRDGSIFTFPSLEILWEQSHGETDVALEWMANGDLSENIFPTFLLAAFLRPLVTK